LEGTVKLALDVTTGTSKQGHPWSKQFFVLASDTAEIACSMWDATDNEVKKGERVHIENTQNKKGEWKGMVKGSYQKNGERKHTLEIRAEQVRIKTLSGGITAKTTDIPQSEHIPDPDWPEAPATAPELPLPTVGGNGGVMEARQHLMKACNLYNLCIKTAVTSICPNIPDEQRTNDQFQSTLASLWIEASSRRCTDGVNWWSFIDRMPDKPL
jgi:hypothetical protein